MIISSCDKLYINMPNINGEITELELENELIKQLRLQFHRHSE